MWSFVIAALAGHPAHADTPRKSVEKALRAWVEATDGRDAATVESLFQPHAVQLVQLGDKQMSLSTEVYVGMLRDGKIGGGRTELSVHDVAVQGDLAIAHTTRKAPAIVMNDAVVLERTDTGWRIASAVIHATPQ